MPFISATLVKSIKTLNLNSRFKLGTDRGYRDCIKHLTSAIRKSNFKRKDDTDI
jgi:hypothetical protein